MGMMLRIVSITIQWILSHWIPDRSIREWHHYYFFKILFIK